MSIEAQKTPTIPHLLPWARNWGSYGHPGKQRSSWQSRHPTIPGLFHFCQSDTSRYQSLHALPDPETMYADETRDALAPKHSI